MVVATYIMHYLDNKDVVTGFPPYSYQAALQAKKERTSKAAASFGPKSRYQTNLKEVCKHNIDYTLCIYTLGESFLKMQQQTFSISEKCLVVA